MKTAYSSIEYSNLSNRQLKRIRFEASQARSKSIKDAATRQAELAEQAAFKPIAERIKSTYSGEGMFKGYVCKQAERFDFNPDTYEPRLGDFAEELPKRNFRR